MGENKYKNGKIYKIVDVGYNKCYIGSTCESLSKRMARHRSIYLYGSEKDKGRRINSLFNDFGIENCKIELVEEYPCSNKMELLRQEGYHIRENECVNKIVAGRTLEEYNKQNAEKIQAYRKQYNEEHKEEKKQHYKDNKERYKESNEKFRKENPEKIKAISDRSYQNNKDKILHRNKTYRQNNRDRFREYTANYREKNRDEINTKRKEKTVCSCGTTYRKTDTKRHEKSQKHQDWLKQQEE